MDVRLQQGLRARAARESGEGTRLADAPLRMSLLYPSPYRSAMSSLGYLQVHRLANARAGTRCERACLPDPGDRERHERTRTPLLTLESGRPAADVHVLGVSLAYELELAGLVSSLELCGLEPLATARGPGDPLVVLGGPLTFSNPLPAAPFADVVLLGEAEQTLGVLLDALEADPDAACGDPARRRALLETLAGRPGLYVPSLHGEALPAVARAPDAMLPAFSALWTPDTELADMFLIEPERGCHRGCTFCVMRRSTNGGMRLVPAERVLAEVPAAAERVGLVGAAVTDHPGIRAVLRELVDVRGKRIGISSLRADRLDDELVGLLARGGYRSITVALDATSAGLRDAIDKNLADRHIEAAVQLAKAHGMRHVKIYVIVGLPGETDDDIDELIGLSERLGRVLPIVLAISPFVPKLRTPLAQAPFAGPAVVADRIERLRRGTGGRVSVRTSGPREAYVEYRLAQGGHAHAHAAIAAAHAGGRLAAWKRALADLPERVEPPNMSSLVVAPTARRRHRAGDAPVVPQPSSRCGPFAASALPPS